MDLTTIHLQSAEPGQHYAGIARLMSSQETEPTTQESLMEWYSKRQERGIRMNVALNIEEEVCGFICIYRDNLNIEGYYGMYLIVEQAFRRQGLGSFLCEQLLTQAKEMGALTLRTRVRDTSEEGIRFAVKRGFVEKKHSIEMKLDLQVWDDQRFNGMLKSLTSQGFRFTNMGELGDTQ